MNIFELLHNNKTEKHFSFEVLPPLKGNGTTSLFKTIDILKDYNPLFINITNHSSEYIYKELENGLSRMLMICFDIEHLTGKEAIELVRMHQKQ